MDEEAIQVKKRKPWRSGVLAIIAAGMKCARVRASGTTQIDTAAFPGVLQSEDLSLEWKAVFCSLRWKDSS